MKKKIYLTLLFFIFFVILFLSPISGDDWGNHLVGSVGFRHSIGNAIGMYFDWEGRFISRILINLLTYNKWLWNIVNSLLLVSIIYFSLKLINPKNKKFILISLIMMLLFMNIYTFSQVVVWIAGNITYLFVIPLLLGYFYYLINDFSSKKSTIVFFSILNMIMTMFVEHMAVILILGNFLILISRFIKNKKIDKEVLIYLGCSIVGTGIMLLSPGSLKRSGMENIEFSKLSFIGKLIYNIPNFIYYTFIINSFLLIIISLSNYYLIKENINNKVIKSSLIIFMLFVPLLTSVTYILNSFNISILSVFSNQNNIFIIVYYIIYTIISFILLIIDTKSDKKKIILFFFILGICSNIIMMISPTWGYRTSFGTYVFLFISSLMIIDKYIKENKILLYSSNIILITSVIFYFILYTSVHLQYKDNLKLINKGIKNKDTEIIIFKYPSFVNCNINPENDYHMKKFKEYYGIDQDVEVSLIDNKWKYIIFYHK